MIAEMDLLLLDDEKDIRYNHTRWTYMFNVGTFDLCECRRCMGICSMGICSPLPVRADEGLQQAAQQFADYSIERYDAVSNLHTVSGP